MKKRKFEDWEFEQIHKEFRYTRHYRGFAPLERWLATEMPISEAEKARLTVLSDRLFHYVETWNESFYFSVSLLSWLIFIASVTKFLPNVAFRQPLASGR